MLCHLTRDMCERLLRPTDLCPVYVFNVEMLPKSTTSPSSSTPTKLNETSRELSRIGLTQDQPISSKHKTNLKWVPSKSWWVPLQAVNVSQPSGASLRWRWRTGWITQHCHGINMDQKLAGMSPTTWWFYWIYGRNLEETTYKRHFNLVESAE